MLIRGFSFTAIVYILLHANFLFAQGVIDIFIDIDGVLLKDPSLFSSETRAKETVISYVHEGISEFYPVVSGAGEFLESLARIPDVRLSIFSTGIEARNIAVLKALTLSDGRSAYDLFQGRIFSRENAKLIKGERKKDLKGVSPDIDLERAILIDDSQYIVPNEQARNLLWVKGAEFNPKSLAVTRAILEDAMTMAKDRGVSPVAALKSIQWERFEIDEDGDLDKEYRKGLGDDGMAERGRLLIERGRSNCRKLLRNFQGFLKPAN